MEEDQFDANEWAKGRRSRRRIASELYSAKNFKVSITDSAVRQQIPLRQQHVWTRPIPELK